MRERGRGTGARGGGPQGWKPGLCGGHSHLSLCKHTARRARTCTDTPELNSLRLMHMARRAPRPMQQARTHIHAHARSTRTCTHTGTLRHTNSWHPHEHTGICAATCPLSLAPRFWFPPTCIVSEYCQRTGGSQRWAQCHLPQNRPCPPSHQGETPRGQRNWASLKEGADPGPAPWVVWVTGCGAARGLRTWGGRREACGG